MFLRVHLKPRASNGSENATFLRDLLLFFNQQDQTLVCGAIKKCFLKHATAWLNPTNVAVTVFCDNPLFLLSAVLAAEQFLPSHVHTHKMLWIQEPSTIILSGKSKCRPFSQYCDARFKRSINSHNRTSGHCQLSEREVCNSIGTISKIQADKRMIGYVLNE